MPCQPCLKLDLDAAQPQRTTRLQSMGVVSDPGSNGQISLQRQKNTSTASSALSGKVTVPCRAWTAVLGAQALSCVNPVMNPTLGILSRRMPRPGMGTP